MGRWGRTRSPAPPAEPRSWPASTEPAATRRAPARTPSLQSQPGHWPATTCRATSITRPTPTRAPNAAASRAATPDSNSTVLGRPRGSGAVAARFDDRAVTELLERAVHEGVFPGAVLLVADAGQPIYVHACGHAQLVPEAGRRPATRDTVYDLPSLTKPLGTTLLSMRLHEAGLLDLDAPAQRLLPELVHARPRVRDLLAHAAGFPTHRPYWEHPRARTLGLLRRRLLGSGASDRTAGGRASGRARAGAPARRAGLRARSRRGRHRARPRRHAAGRHRARRERARDGGRGAARGSVRHGRRRARGPGRAPGRHAGHGQDPRAVLCARRRAGLDLGPGLGPPGAERLLGGRLTASPPSGRASGVHRLLDLGGAPIQPDPSPPRQHQDPRLPAAPARCRVRSCRLFVKPPLEGGAHHFL